MIKEGILWPGKKQRTLVRLRDRYSTMLYISLPEEALVRRRLLDCAAGRAGLYACGFVSPNDDFSQLMKVLAKIAAVESVKQPKTEWTDVTFRIEVR